MPAPVSRNASSCRIQSDPGGIGQAPFFEEPSTGQMAFLPMNDFSFASRGCPALGTYGAVASAPGCMSTAPCLPPSPDMTNFFGNCSHGPAVWSVRPDLDRPKLESRASS